MTLAEACKLAADKHVYLHVCSGWIAGGYLRVKVASRTKDGRHLYLDRVYHPNDIFDSGFELVVDCDVRAMIDEIVMTREKEDTHD